MHPSVTAHYSSAGETDDRALASIFAAYTVRPRHGCCLPLASASCSPTSLAHLISAVYSSLMPPFAERLADADIANIINYERSAWGNHGAPVTTQQVAGERGKGK